jgi:uncharacterized protein YfaS (alpha-2-macroglobulin family)
MFTFFVVITGNTSSTLSITVETSKPSYNICEPIIAYGILKFGDSAIQNGLVAFEVQDPDHSSVITLTLQTDTNGDYNVTFELSEYAPLGTYTVYVSSTYENETATNNATFTVNQFIITIETDKTSYRIGETVYVGGKLVLNNALVQNGLVAFEVQNPEYSSILLITLQTNSNGTYEIAFKLPDDSKLGNYTVYVSSICGDAKAVNNTSFEALRRALSGDIDGNGIVNIHDLYIVAKAFGSHGPDIPNPGDPPSKNWNPIADLDGNGLVNISDLFKVAKDWGKTIE